MGKEGPPFGVIQQSERRDAIDRALNTVEQLILGGELLRDNNCILAAHILRKEAERRLKEIEDDSSMIESANARFGALVGRYYGLPDNDDLLGAL